MFKQCVASHIRYSHEQKIYATGPSGAGELFIFLSRAKEMGLKKAYQPMSCLHDSTPVRFETKVSIILTRHGQSS